MSTGQSRPGRSIPVTRRAVLAGTAAATLAACAGGSSGGSAVTTSSPTPSAATAPLPNATDAVAAALEAAGLGSAELALTPQPTWAELLVGLATDLLLVVTDTEGEVVSDPVEVWLVDLDGEVATGPLTTTWYADERLPTEGLHAVEVDLGEDQAGTYDLVVASTDRARAGTAAIRALPPDESIAPAPGDAIPPVATATADDPMGVEELCTREEDCGLHEVGLAEALAGDAPVVLCVATPKYCATAICGPVLEDVLAVAGSGEHDDVTFLHVEPYRDDELTPVELVEELELPTEPWTWVLQPGGVIVDRFPGPVLPDLLHGILDDLPAPTPASPSPGES